VVSPSTASIGKGVNLQLSATYNGPGTSNQTVNWSVTGGDASTMISSTGVLRVGISDPATTLTVRATSRNNTSKYGTATVTITGGAATVGTIGPGGGYIFYDKGSYSDGWRYMEAAPASAEFRSPFDSRSTGNYISYNETLTGIGTGRANTEHIISKLDAVNDTGQSAARQCAALQINGLTDWFLPSRDELYEMYFRLALNGNIGGFILGGSGTTYEWIYWSSSCRATGLVGNCWETYCLNFYSGVSLTDFGGTSLTRHRNLSVRAVRAY